MRKSNIAILSFADPDFVIPPIANAIIGVVAGTGAMILGVMMVVRIRRIQNEKNYQSAYRKIKRLMKKEALPYKIKPVRYVTGENGEIFLYIRFPKEMSAYENEKLNNRVREELHIELLAVAK